MLEDNSISVASFAFGILSICFYSVVYYPQFYVIYKTEKTDGISFWMLLMWGQADFISLVGTILLNLELTLIVIGWYHALVGLLMTVYTLLYEKDNKLTKYSAVAIYYVVNVSVCVYLNVTMVYNFEAGSTVGWVSSVLYIIGRLPQLYLNYKRNSTEGLSILMYVFTILGNMCYLLATITFSLDAEYIILNLPWIIMIIVTVTMDLVVISQAFYYKGTRLIDVSDLENTTG